MPLFKFLQFGDMKVEIFVSTRLERLENKRCMARKLTKDPTGKTYQNKTSSGKSNYQLPAKWIGIGKLPNY